MPLYEYECDACGERFDVIQKFSDPPPDACRKCGKGPIQRLFSSPAIQFKGSGFYITDYAQKGKSEGESKGTGKSDEGKAEGKTDGKTDGKTESAAPKETSTKTDTASGSSSSDSTTATTTKRD